MSNINMRTQKEIDIAITIFAEENRTDKVEAILDVLENDLDEEVIEDRYYDEQGIWVEQAALSAREFLDGEKKMEEIDEYPRV